MKFTLEVDDKDEFDIHLHGRNLLDAIQELDQRLRQIVRYEPEEPARVKFAEEMRGWIREELEANDVLHLLSK